MRKGKITKIEQENDGTKEAYMFVSPIEDAEIEYKIIFPWFLRGEMGKNLAIGDFVCFEMFVDGSGFCVARSDGTWNPCIYGNPLNLGDLGGKFVALAETVNQNFSALKSAFNGHTHSGVTVGTGGTGTTTSPLPDLSDTSATKTKAV